MVASGTKLPLGRRVVLDEQKLLDLIDRMRVSIPEDVRVARRTMEERTRIISEAQSEAEQLRQELESELRVKLQGSEFVRLAEQRALEITSDAERRANALLREAEAEVAVRREGADQYALDVLQRLEGQLSVFLNSIKKGIGAIEGTASSRTLEDNLPGSAEETNDRGKKAVRRVGA